jgi:predicted DNA-binding transcriptional regulator YafY
MKTERLLGIILLLESRKKLSAQELARLFEVSERTIYRDVKLLVTL